ncbi:MAG TPA: hypothetical protein VH302_02880 [Bryobacteraceae bacterium]|jgi:hypothetical protein|nr:hypothetical protein [Bryobacteraceae bacterium]
MPASLHVVRDGNCHNEHDGIQLSRLSSVLNGLEGGAQIIQQHLCQTSCAVKAGTYLIDPIQLSRRIVGEALRTL